MEKESNKGVVLLIAPLGGGSSSANVVGGNKVMADEQACQLAIRGFSVDGVDTSGNVTNMPRWRIKGHRLARFLRVVSSVALKMWRSDIVFLITASYSVLGLASFLWVLCRISGKPFVLRITGGDLMIDYLGYGRLANRAWMRAELVYVETQHLQRNFEHRSNFRWFPNTRDIESYPPPQHTPAGLTD